MTGWGPALGMAYAFVALQELQTWGASLWRSVMGWTLLNIAVAQLLVWYGVLPSILPAPKPRPSAPSALRPGHRHPDGRRHRREEGQAEAHFGHQALHDMLTGLPNRACSTTYRPGACAGGQEGSSTAVMLFDLDRFKEINDTMGHNYGDRVLTEVGPRVN